MKKKENSDTINECHIKEEISEECHIKEEISEECHIKEEISEEYPIKKPVSEEGTIKEDLTENVAQNQLNSSIHFESKDQTLIKEEFDVGCKSTEEADIKEESLTNEDRVHHLNYEIWKPSGLTGSSIGE